jgi:hypothetical protein
MMRKKINQINEKFPLIHPINLKVSIVKAALDEGPCQMLFSLLSLTESRSCIVNVLQAGNEIKRFPSGLFLCLLLVRQLQ